MLFLKCLNFKLLQQIDKITIFINNNKPVLDFFCELLYLNIFQHIRPKLVDNET